MRELCRHNRAGKRVADDGSVRVYVEDLREQVDCPLGPLIEIYRAVRRHPEQILKFLRPLKPTKSAFNQIKSLAARNDVQLAGSFIFLNRACWNGLYRVNSDGMSFGMQ